MGEEMGDAGSSALKTILTDAVIEHFATPRRRRTDYAPDHAHAEELLRCGYERVKQLAEATTSEVRDAMGPLS